MPVIRDETPPKPAPARPGPASRAASGLVRSLEHPVDRRESPRGTFDRFSERVSFLASSPLFFVVCAALVIAWGLGFMLGAGNRAEAAGAGLMSALTLILVATLKNSEQRAERALQTKLDAIATALLEDRRGHTEEAEQQLEDSIGVHEQM